MIRSQARTDATEVNKPRQFYALAVALIVTVALASCATYSKCGLHGCAGDAQITAEVERLLGQHAALGPPNIVHVQTSDRVVYLSGQVNTDMQRQEAASVAGEAEGVARVVNSITIYNQSGK